MSNSSATNSAGAQKDVHVTKRHPIYYFEGGDLHVVVAETLFRVHSYFFIRESRPFHRKANPVSPGSPREGLTELAPILLENISPEEFETFLWVFYNPLLSVYETTIEKWKMILRLADLWDFKEVKELAVRELHKKQELDLVDRLALYQNYKVDPCHLVPLYGFLCARDTPLTLQESKILGLDTTLLIANMREQLRALPSNEGRSPLPEGLEMTDVFRALERDMKLEEGATAKLYPDADLSRPSNTPSVPNLANGKISQGAKGGKKK